MSPHVCRCVRQSVFINVFIHLALVFWFIMWRLVMHSQPCDYQYVVGSKILHINIYDLKLWYMANAFWKKLWLNNWLSLNKRQESCTVVEFGTLKSGLVFLEYSIPIGQSWHPTIGYFDCRLWQRCKFHSFALLVSRSGFTRFKQTQLAPSCLSYQLRWKLPQSTPYYCNSVAMFVLLLKPIVLYNDMDYFCGSF